MKHVNLLLFATLLAVLAGCSRVSQKDSDPRVWNSPNIESSAFTLKNGGWDFIIQKVYFGNDETTVYMKVNGYEGRSYTFASETSLKADGKSYAMKSVEGITPGQYKPMGKSNTEYLVFHFEPMPLNTKSFDLIESQNLPGAFNLFGIHKNSPDSPALMNTNWVNVRTGDWTISFMNDFVIYDCKLWQYETSLKDNEVSAQTVTISNGDDKAVVQIGQLKHGKRSIKVQAPNGTMQHSCALFESRNLPDYPRIERRVNTLVDYGYENADPVTVSGMLIGNNRSNMTFTLDVIDPISGENSQVAATTDEKGYFTVTFPLPNTVVTVARSRNGAAGFSIPIEPGRTYFIYSDVLSGREYVMGSKARIQNEFLTHYDDFYADYDRFEESEYSTDMEAYLNYLIGERNKHFAHLDSLLKVHPSISDGYLEMSRVYATTEMYRMIGQSRFHNQDSMYELPAFMTDFIRNDLKVNSIAPYSLFYDFNYFVVDLVQSLYQTPKKSVRVDMTDIINYVIENKVFELTADETEQLRNLARINDMVSSAVLACGTDNERINDTIAKILTPQVQAEVEKANKTATEKGLMEYFNEYAQKIAYDKEFHYVVDALDSLGFEKRLNEIFLTHYLVSEITSSRHSAPAAIIAQFDSIVTYKPCVDAVHAQNEKYQALENIDLASLGNVVSDQEIAAMSDGEAILRKITEPYRGKIVYIDVWGSWCHPCLENLKHAGELKEALKDFDIVYLYLASSTTENAWKGVIKEYNLAGPDCVHYNLPGNQQALVEQFLKVEGYPTYRLLNRNGALLDVSCHPGNLPALIETLKKL